MSKQSLFYFFLLVIGHKVTSFTLVLADANPLRIVPVNLKLGSYRVAFRERDRIGDQTVFTRRNARTERAAAERNENHHPPSAPPSERVKRVQEPVLGLWR